MPKEDPRLAKYRRMVQFGVPVEAVAQCMQLQGLDGGLLGPLVPCPGPKRLREETGVAVRCRPDSTEHRLETFTVARIQACHR